MIKKSLLLLMLSASAFATAKAQVVNAGFPWSINQNNDLAFTELNFPATDNTENLNRPQPSAYMVATTFPVDISFPESGILVKTPNGFVWKVKLTVNEAKAIGTYLDRFDVPKGVSLYVMNANHRHIVGPFTTDDVDPTGHLPIEAVQGSEVYLELNIEESVNLSDIDIHIYKLASYFRGVEDLEYYVDDSRYGTIDWYDEAAYETSSKCMINAVCPEADGGENMRNATVKQIIESGGGVGYCSGTMVNAIGNSPENCKRYLLTATHCEGSNATSGPVFANWITKFNYQTPECDNPTTAPVANNITGVKFIARDPYSESAPASALDADFLLVQIEKPAPAVISSNAIMVGFDRNPDHTRAYLSPRKFRFFHHPAGDVKKYSSTRNIIIADEATWGAQFQEGYGAPGSSGSGMFDADGRIIGIASTAIYGDVLHDSCLYSARGILEASNTSRTVYYARVDYSWNNPSLGSPSDAQKLAPWLDPTGSSSMQSPTVNWRCEAVETGIEELETAFDGDFNIYPNPSSNGVFQMNIRMNTPSNATLEVYDITGKKVMGKDLGKLHSQIVNLDLSSMSNGTYMVKVYNPYGQVTRKVVIAK